MKITLIFLVIVFMVVTTQVATAQEQRPDQQPPPETGEKFKIGMCLDIGHDTRNGKDPVADLKKYISRIFDIHVKDVTGTTRLGYSLEVGRGIINFPAFVKMLRAASNMRRI